MIKHQLPTRCANESYIGKHTIHKAYRIIARSSRKPVFGDTCTGDREVSDGLFHYKAYFDQVSPALSAAADHPEALTIC